MSGAKVVGSCHAGSLRPRPAPPPVPAPHPNDHHFHPHLTGSTLIYHHHQHDHPSQHSTQCRAMVRLFRAVETAPLLAQVHRKSGALFVCTLLCIELKLHVDDPNHTWNDQLEFWDSIGNPEDDNWPEVTATELVRATKISKAKDNTPRGRKRKLGDSESFAPTPASTD